MLLSAKMGKHWPMERHSWGLHMVQSGGPVSGGRRTASERRPGAARTAAGRDAARRATAAVSFMAREAGVGAHEFEKEVDRRR